MMNDKHNLAARLLYLPLDLPEKVLLWLTYRDLKPVSEITIVRRRYSPGFKGKHKETSADDKKVQKIKHWLKDAGLYFFSDPKNNVSWHVSHDKAKAQLSAKILKKLDYENECLSGRLFGFPEKSVKAYAHNRKNNFEKDQIPMISPFSKSFYEFYAVRADMADEEIKPAVVWQETIRKEVPLLAEWYEKRMRKIL